MKHVQRNYSCRNNVNVLNMKIWMISGRYIYILIYLICDSISYIYLRYLHCMIRLGSDTSTTVLPVSLAWFCYQPSEARKIIAQVFLKRRVIGYFQCKQISSPRDVLTWITAVFHLWRQWAVFAVFSASVSCTNDHLHMSCWMFSWQCHILTHLGAGSL